MFSVIKQKIVPLNTLIDIDRKCHSLQQKRDDWQCSTQNWMDVFSFKLKFYSGYKIISLNISFYSHEPHRECSYAFLFFPFDFFVMLLN